MRSSLIAAVAATVALGASAHAGVNLVQNGDFSGPTNLVNGSGQSTYYRDTGGAGYIADWTYTVPGGPGSNNGGIITVLASSNLNSPGNQLEGPYSFWNSSNGGVGELAAPPSGDQFVLGQDTAPENAAYLSQTITGLTVGQTYALTFAYAGAQLRNSDGSDWNGATNLGVEANLGGTYNLAAPGGTTSQAYIGGQTDVVYYDGYAATVPNHGSTAWQDATLLFKATAGSEVLNLEAISTSSGDPPFALIDNVSLIAVPEPVTWAMMLVGLGGVGALARRRRALSAVAA